jgi:hypothetical protein
MNSHVIRFPKLLCACSLVPLMSALLAYACTLIMPNEAHGQGPAPTVAVTSPTESSTVMGTVTVTATATATGVSDYPTAIRFYDGVNEIADERCDGQRVCTISTSWHATGDTGQHTLTVKAETNEGGSMTSAPVQVTVVSPPPTVSITSPSSGSTVKGNVVIAISGATNPSQVEYPTSIIVYDGVNQIGEIRCQGQQTCAGSITWHATGLSGQHVLTAKIETNRSLTVTSAATTVTVESPPPHVAITSPARGRELRGVITVIVSGATDPSQVDYPTSIQVYDGTDEIGSVSCQGQPTCSGSVKWATTGLTGRHVLTAVIHTYDGYSATSAPVVVGGSPPRRYSKPVCRMASYTVALRRLDRGVCTVGGVPRGTSIAIEAKGITGGWVTAVRGHIGRSGTFHFSLKVVKRSTFRLAVLVGATHAYSATRVGFGTLQVG